MPILRPDVVLSTCFDERFPASNVLDGLESTFYLTTGLFPQEILMNFSGDEVSVNRIQLVCHGVKAIKIERCTEHVPSAFEPVVDCELASPPSGLQREQFQVNKATVGNGVRFLKIIIASGYEQFAAIHSIVVEGDGPSRA